MKISPFRGKSMVCNRLGYVKCSNMSCNHLTFVVTKLIPQLICIHTVHIHIYIYILYTLRDPTCPSQSTDLSACRSV